MCISDVITNEALKLEVESLRNENAALKAELAQQTHNSKSMQCRFEEADCRGLIRYCKKCGVIINRL